MTRGVATNHASLGPNADAFLRFSRKAEWIDRSAVVNGVETHCWEWRAATVKGPDGEAYGRFFEVGRHCMAHRWIWERWYGSIPKGFEIDHLCEHKLCVNPRHMEVVTRKVNNQRRIMRRLGVPIDTPFESLPPKWTMAKREAYLAKIGFSGETPFDAFNPHPPKP